MYPNVLPFKIATCVICNVNSSSWRCIWGAKTILQTVVSL